jgi:hypothetical protein
LIIINNFIDTDRCAQSLQNYIQYAKYPKRLKFGVLSSPSLGFLDDRC